jgi:hypothetical protein
MSMKMKASANVNLQAVFAAPREAAGPTTRHYGDDLPFARLCLAVRGWVTPTNLVRNLAGGRGGDMLAALAGEVETTAATRSGQWFMQVEPRRQAIATAFGDEVVRALAPHLGSDGQDVILSAFRLALDDKPVDLAALSDKALRALANVRDWLGDRWRLPFDKDEIGAALACKVLAADLERMTAQPLVGTAHRDALAILERFVLPGEDARLRAIYVQAAGGGGKTTLLAYLQRKLQERAGGAAIARIDFDEPGIDPSRMITLNLALFEQLASSLSHIRARVSDFLPQLRGAASALRLSDYAGWTPLAGWSSGQRGRRSLGGQRQVSESVSDQGSILFGLLSPDSLHGPLVLVLDTAELVMEGDSRAAAGIADWLDFLATEVQAYDIRLIIAGRDPPPREGGPQVGEMSLFARLERMGAGFDPPIFLPELVPSEAAELLANCGVGDEKLRHAAAGAVPGNPLLLRITADALRDGDARLVQDIHAVHGQAQVDPHSARIYLLRRVIAHVSDPLVRPYVIAAMASPILTSAMLGTVIIPLIDGEEKGEDGIARRAAGRRKPRRVFAGIERTAWLGRASPDGKLFTFNRDLRRFVMTLVQAVDDDRKLHNRAHKALLTYHERRRDPLGRALTYYHKRALGGPAKLPRGDKSLKILRGLLDQFPEAVEEEVTAEIDALLLSRQFIVVRDRFGPVPPVIAVGRGGAVGGAKAEAISSQFEAISGNMRLDDRDWRFHLEGREGKPGQGDQLVGDDRAAEALIMYRERPTREPGVPPTFVIQAVADLGEWDCEDIDISAVVEDLSSKLSPRSVNANIDRIYWITRFALQRDTGKLGRMHIDLLQTVCNYLTGPGLATLPPLLAVAEAFCDERLMSPRMMGGIRGNEGEGRIYLVRRQQLNAELAIGQFAVTQRDWLARIRRTRAVASAEALSWVQRQIDDLHGQPIAMVNQQFMKLREGIEIDWEGRDLSAGTLLLRGMTAEFLRPLREGMAGVIAGGGMQRLRPILDRATMAMTVRPAELEPDTFHERLRANPRAWLSAFVSYADRSRLLPGLCADLADTLASSDVAGARVARVARSYLVWDEALGGGSDWRIESPSA